MDKRTRMLNAMNKLPVDHVPVGMWFHFSGEEEKGQACIDAHLKYYRETDLDFLKIMCDGYFPYPFNAEIKEASDWYKVTPLGKDHPYITEQVARAKAIVREIGKERCVFYNVFAPFSSIRFSYPDEFVMKHLREDKLAVMHALDVIAQDHALLCDLLINEAGCDGVYFCVQGGEYNRFTPEEYWEMISPSEMYVLEHANRYSENNILHCCGWAGATNQLELWEEYPAKVVNWAVHVEGLSLEDGRYFFGDRATLGGLETHWEEDHTHKGMIYDATKEELQDYIREIIVNHGKLGFILGGDCTIDATIDLERVRWIVEAARSI